MHLIVVTNRLMVGEGQGRVNYELARSAARSGHTVTCLASHVDNQLLMEPTVEWVHMPDANWPNALIGNLRFSIASTRWLERFRGSADLVVANGANTWAPVDVNIVHFVHSAWRMSPAHDAQVQTSLQGAYQWVYSWLNAILECKVLPRARRIIAVSEKVRQELSAIGLPDEKTQVIHNGVDIGEFCPGPTHRPSLGLPVSVPLGLFVGDIQTSRKGCDTLLHAVSGAPAVHVAIAGQVRGSPFPALAEQLGIRERVHFLGYRKDIPDLMRASDFFVFPSRYEACSLVLLEALGSGLPIITARSAGGAELIEGLAGVVLDDPNDFDALARVMKDFVSDEQRLERRRQSARRIAEENSWQIMAEKYLKLFERASAHELVPS